MGLNFPRQAAVGSTDGVVTFWDIASSRLALINRITAGSARVCSLSIFVPSDLLTNISRAKSLNQATIGRGMLDNSPSSHFTQVEQSYDDQNKATSGRMGSFHYFPDKIKRQYNRDRAMGCICWSSSSLQLLMYCTREAQCH